MACVEYKTKLKDLYPGGNARANLIYTEFKNLLMNALTIKGLDFTTEAFVKNNLIETGKVGYDKLTNQWANVYGQGLDKMGNPTQLTFVFRNGVSFQRQASYTNEIEGAYIIKATPDAYAIADVIAEATNFIENCHRATEQNMEACKTPFIVVCKNEQLRLSLEHAIQQKQHGQAVIVVSDELGDALKGISIETNYLCDKFEELENHKRDLLLNKLGIMSANINKKERVQVGEVNATTGQCMDYIYLLIDTFNKQMESFGIPYTMELNGSLEDLYGNGNDTDEDNEVLDNDKL